MVKQHIFSIDSFAIKITTYYNKNHKTLQQKYHVFAIFLRHVSIFQKKSIKSKNCSKSPPPPKKTLQHLTCYFTTKNANEYVTITLEAC
jgi:hypothetical protein